MRKVLFLFLGLMLSGLVFGKGKKAHHQQYQFLENKGQFPSQVNFRAEIPNGLFFIENATFTYHFYDGEVRQNLHDGTYDGDLNNVPMRFHAYKAEFLGANQNPKVTSSEQFSNYYNFFIGNDPAKWAGNVKAYAQVKNSNLYDGIDLAVYSDPHKGIKYDLIVKSGANPNKIQINYQGVDSIYIKRGRLYVITSLNENWEEKPEAYQIVDGERVKVNCKYALKDHTLSYIFPDGYDETNELIIDPVLVFSSYTGSTSNNFGYTATYDKFGFLYSGSSSFNPGYPVTVGAYQTNWAGGTGSGTPGLSGTDMAITKWDTTGTTLIYSTYLGGSSDELPHSLVVTDFSELYVMGTTGSTNFPTTTGAFDTVFNIHPNGAIPVNLLSGLAAYYLNGADIVISKFDSSGSVLDASTFLGGTDTDGLNTGGNKFNYADEIRGEIDLDNNGKVYVATCTYSNDNPVDSNGFQTTKPFPTAPAHIDGVVYKLNHNLTSLEWTNYLGGSGDDAAYSIVVGAMNDIYVTGGTESSTFPITLGSFDVTHNGGNDGFVSHINSSGTTLLHSSFYGTAAYDQSYFVEIDNNQDVYLFGQTSGPTGALISNATFNVPLGGQFIVKLNSVLDTTIWATRFGVGDGNPDISPTAFLVDLCNAVYLSGWGAPIQGGGLSTTGLPTGSTLGTPPIQTTTDGADFYVMVMSDDASSLDYATFFGGSASEHVDGGTSRFDRKGKIYQAVCAGCGGSDDFPTTSNAVSNVNGTTAGCNLAIFKMDFLLPIVVADFSMPTTGCAPFPVTFDNLSLTQSATNFFWTFGDGTTSTLFEPTHTYNAAGVYTVTLVVNDNLTCNLGDTLTKTITILGNSYTVLPTASICDQGVGTQIGIPQNNDPNLTYSWTPNNWLSDTSITNPIANPPVNTTYYLSIGNGVCYDTVQQSVIIDSTTVQIFGDSTVCTVDAPYLLSSNVFGVALNHVWSNNSDFSDTLNTDSLATTIFVAAPDSVNWYHLAITTPLGCTVTDSFKISVIDVQNPITASFDDPGQGCAPYNVFFQNTTNGTSQSSYLWDFGNGSTSNLINPSTIFNAKGNYPVTLIVFDTSICPQSDTVTIWVQTREDSNYTVSHFACYNQDSPIGIPADTFAGTTYTWIPTTGLSDPTIHNPTVNTTNNLAYLLIVQHVCTDSVIDSVYAEPIFAISPTAEILCSDDLNYTLVGNSLGSGENFVWSTNPNFTDTLNTALWDSTLVGVQVDPVTTYYFRVESPNGCLDSSVTEIVVSDLNVDVTPDKYICNGDTTTLSATNSYPANVLDFFWSPANQIIGPIDTETITVAPLNNTLYTVSAINDSGCVFKDSILVEVSPLTQAQVIVTADLDSIVEGTSTTVYVTPATGYLYQWEPSDKAENPNESSTNVFPTETTTFTATVTDPRNTNCSYKNDVQIRIYEINCGEPEIFIPNAFSPNFDGDHDEYYVQGQVIETLELKIYNRWGQLVFETTDKEQGWDGRFNGEIVDPDVFVYHLNAVCIDGQEFKKKGNITVVR